MKANRPAVPILLLAATLLACARPAEMPAARDAFTVDAISSAGVDAGLSFQSDWGAGYCANVTLSNGSAAPVTSWTVVLDLHQSTVSQQPWGRRSGSNDRPRSRRTLSCAASPSASASGIFVSRYLAARL